MWRTIRSGGKTIAPGTSPFGQAAAFGFASAFSGLCMDVYGDSHAAGAEIDSWYCNGNLNQQFFLDTQVPTRFSAERVEGLTSGAERGWG
jgi:hypothetical protein